MTSNIKATRTVNPLHFEDLEPHRFEDLIRQLAYEYKTWRSLEATGRLGSDDGLDIRGIEVITVAPYIDIESDGAENILYTEERIWAIQCKRYQKISPNKMQQIVDETIPQGSIPPYGLIVAVACDVTKKTMDVFRQAAVAKGVQEFDLWTKARLEDMLFQPRYDHLLFAYFNLSLSIRRREATISLQKKLAIKNKIRRTLLNKDQHIDGIRSEINKTVLIRNITDEEYPFESAVHNFASLKFPPWYPLYAYRVGVRGLVVALGDYVGWVEPDKTWDILDSGPNTLINELTEYRLADSSFIDPEILDQAGKLVPSDKFATIRIIRSIPWHNIIDVDPDGDSYCNIPHLYCNFDTIQGPYSEKIYYLCTKHKSYEIEGEELDPQKRVKLFP